MAEAEAIIIKRVKKGGHAAHHGGAWKVAYADFVTAMMAFFLLLWLLNATTEAQKQGIADYFSPTSVSMSSGGAGGMLGGQTISSPGAMTSRTAVPSVSIELKPTTGATDGDADVEGGANDKEKSAEQATANNAEALKKLEEQQKEIENAQFEAIEQQIRQAIQETPELKDLEQHLLIDRTPDGLRIQVIDREGKPMFKSGSAEMLPHTAKLVAQIATAIKSLPNKVRITGHTDSVPFRGGKNGYGNWELSGDRAQASRRVLVGSGLDQERVESVAGRASRDPLMPDDPESARNRRIGILLLRMPPPQLPDAPQVKPGNPPGATGEPGAGNATGASPAAGKPAPLNKDWTGPRVR
jgi:chemotaxis protein MotB